MPIVWRLSKPEYATRLDGKGNVQRGARWNSPGHGVVYTALNLSLAVLETLVQLPPDLRDHLPAMTAVQIEVPDHVGHAAVSRDQLPSDLESTEAAVRCRQLGDAWISSGRNLALEVPSVIVPQERNLLLNPTHPSMDDVRIVSIEPFRFDSRLISGRR